MPSITKSKKATRKGRSSRGGGTRRSRPQAEFEGGGVLGALENTMDVSFLEGAFSPIAKSDHLDTSNNEGEDADEERHHSLGSFHDESPSNESGIKNQKTASPVDDDDDKEEENTSQGHSSDDDKSSSRSTSSSVESDEEEARRTRRSCNRYKSIDFQKKKKNKNRFSQYNHDNNEEEERSIIDQELSEEEEDDRSLSSGDFSSENEFVDGDEEDEDDGSDEYNPDDDFAGHGSDSFYTDGSSDELEIDEGVEEEEPEWARRRPMGNETKTPSKTADDDDRDEESPELQQEEEEDDADVPVSPRPSCAKCPSTASTKTKRGKEYNEVEDQSEAGIEARSPPKLTTPSKATQGSPSSHGSEQDQSDEENEPATPSEAVQASPSSKNTSGYSTNDDISVIEGMPMSPDALTSSGGTSTTLFPSESTKEQKNGGPNCVDKNLIDAMKKVNLDEKSSRSKNAPNSPREQSESNAEDQAVNTEGEVNPDFPNEDDIDDACCLFDDDQLAATVPPQQEQHNILNPSDHGAKDIKIGNEARSAVSGSDAHDETFDDDLFLPNQPSALFDNESVSMLQPNAGVKIFAGDFLPPNSPSIEHNVNTNAGKEKNKSQYANNTDKAEDAVESKNLKAASPANTTGSQETGERCIETPIQQPSDDTSGYEVDDEATEVEDEQSFFSDSNNLALEVSQLATEPGGVDDIESEIDVVVAIVDDGDDTEDDSSEVVAAIIEDELVEQEDSIAHDNEGSVCSVFQENIPEEDEDSETNSEQEDSSYDRSVVASKSSNDDENNGSAASVNTAPINNVQLGSSVKSTRALKDTTNKVSKLNQSMQAGDKPSNPINKNLGVKRGKWTLGTKIGRGSFGTVHMCMTDSGTLMAAKVMQVDKTMIEDIRREVDILKRLDHQNIVAYRGSDVKGSKLYIFQEWVPGGSVTSMLGKFGPFAMPVVRIYLKQILMGLAYLHSHNILHRDIKGANVLVNDAGLCKLADFGASKQVQDMKGGMMMTMTMRGTPYFMAPEVFEEKYGWEADLWSVGGVAIQMISGLPPWKQLGISNPVSLYNHIKKQTGPPPLNVSTKSMEGATFMAMVTKCFRQTPSERPNAETLLEDAFFKRAECRTDDDQSITLASPGNNTSIAWDNLLSPSTPQSTIGLSGRPSTYRRNSSARSMKAPFTSPPVPENGILNVPLFKSPMTSPKCDPSEWPSWARANYQQNQTGNASSSPSVSKLGETMGSLAISEDSGDQTLNRRNLFSSTFASDTSTLTLHGEKLLETTNAL